MKKWFKDYFLAHKGNLYKPAIFAIESVITLLLVLFVFEGAYLFHTNIITKSTDFTAAVLPAALSSLTNNDRITKGLGHLEYDSLLTKAAQEKANDMAIHGYFAHVSPTGKTPWFWLDQMGYKYDYAGENLAVNFIDSQDVETAWMNSPSHRDNILKKEYTKSGIAVAQGMYQGQEVTFVVQLFAKPSTALSSTAPIKAPVSRPTNPVVIESKKAESVPGISEKEGSKQVLGATQEQVVVQDANQNNIKEALVLAVASPRYTSENIFFVFIVGILMLLALGIVIHVRVGVRYTTEALGGGLALIVVALAFIFLNKSNTPSVILPNSDQSASVIMSVQ